MIRDYSLEKIEEILKKENLTEEEIELLETEKQYSKEDLKDYKKEIFKEGLRISKTAIIALLEVVFSPMWFAISFFIGGSIPESLIGLHNLHFILSVLNGFRFEESLNNFSKFIDLIRYGYIIDYFELFVDKWNTKKTLRQIKRKISKNKKVKTVEESKVTTNLGEKLEFKDTVLETSYELIKKCQQLPQEKMIEYVKLIREKLANYNNSRVNSDNLVEDKISLSLDSAQLQEANMIRDLTLLNLKIDREIALSVKDKEYARELKELDKYVSNYIDEDYPLQLKK